MPRLSVSGRVASSALDAHHLLSRASGTPTKERLLTLAATDVAFSIILPTYDRVHIIDEAIRSILEQTHQNFELIIIDDGSTDATESHIHNVYASDLAQAKIVFIRFSRNMGVCFARNAGLLAARNSWIAYVDSDNLIKPIFLQSFAQAIVKNDGTMTFYSRFFHDGHGATFGEPSDWKRLARGNKIDLGAFVHHVECFMAFDGFDIRLRRLVDWDIIYRYTTKYNPVFVDDALLIYRDDKKLNRITSCEPYTSAAAAILRKIGEIVTITTVIPTYNQELFITQAIESALSQTGDFFHDIVIADDGSTDGTANIISDYCNRYPYNVRSIGDGINRGISANFRRCFATATGAYLAILEGDDYWTDSSKIDKQIQFLEENTDCSMVFSKIELHDLRSGGISTLARQDSIAKDRLDGADILAEPSLNPIANFSSCLFRSDLMKQLPSVLFQHRLSEISLAFHLDRHGPIGFLNEVMSVYRQHDRGVWSGASPDMQRVSGRQTREIAKAVARDIYKHEIQKILDRNYAPPHPQQKQLWSRRIAQFWNSQWFDARKR